TCIYRSRQQVPRTTYDALHSFFLLIRPPPPSTLFPYTTLFRSTTMAMTPIATSDPLCAAGRVSAAERVGADERVQRLELNAELVDRKSTRLNSSHLVISYAVFCLKKKKTKHTIYALLSYLCLIF